MRYSMSVSLAVLLSMRLSGECVADESPTGIPKEWRVEVRTRISDFEQHLACAPSKTIELRSNGKVTETIEPFKSEPKKITEKNVSPENTLTGLHLIWTVLEDAPLLGGNVEDADYSHILIETKDWTWKRSWFDGGRAMRTGEQARVIFANLIDGKMIDSASFRTRHRTPTELREQWMKESQTRNLYISWQGTVSSGRDSMAFASRELGKPKIDLEKDRGALINILADMRDRCLDRETMGDKTVEFSFHSGGGTHTTTIQINGLKAFSEAGPRVETLIRQVQK